MIRKYLFTLSILFLAVLLATPAVASVVLQECPPEECPPDEDEGGGEYCEEFPERCEGEEGGSGDDDDGGDSGPPWDGYTDGRISPDPAEYYTIYCHEGTDTIYVVRVVPQTETIKEIPLADAISLNVGQEQALGDNMVMERSSEEIITIYGSNGNLAPAAGSKAFNLNDCITSNGGPPSQQDTGSPPVDDDDDGDVPEAEEESEEERFRRRRQEAQESLDFCYEAYSFFGGDSNLLADCLNSVLQTYNDVLSGEDVLTLILMVFCLNLIVGNGVLPIGVVLFLGIHRRWLRKQQTL